MLSNQANGTWRAADEIYTMKSETKTRMTTLLD